MRLSGPFLRLLLLLAASWTLAPALSAAPPSAPVSESESQDPVAARLVERLQEDRRAAGVPPVEPHPVLEVVAQELASDVERSGSWSTVDLSADRVARLLKERGYQHYELISTYFAGDGRTAPGPWVDDWMRRARSTFDDIQGEVFRDVGVGRGEVGGLRFYYLVVARERVDYLSAESAGLADLEAVRRQVLEAVNAERQKKGIRPLVLDDDMSKVAQRYAEDMFERGFYGHYSPEGEGIRARVDALRSKKRRARLGENLAGGHLRVEDVVKGWMESPEHRANILQRRFREMGLGLVRGEKDGDFKILWVQVFAGYR